MCSKMGGICGLCVACIEPSGDTRLEPDPAEVLRWYVPDVPMMSAETAQSAMCDTREDGYVYT